MGAPKPGSTLPPQGGKGGVQQPVQPQVPAQGGKTPVPMGGMLGGGGQPQPQSYLQQMTQPGQNIYSGLGVPLSTQPQVPAQGGKAPLTQEQIDALAPNIDPVRPRPFENGPGPRIPAQGGKGNIPLPEHYQSPYANYGFDPALQSYLDQQNFRSATDAGVAFQYDPSNQTFTGGTMAGRYNPIPLSVMQQAAGGNRDALSSYFQPRFPQPTGPVPTVKPGLTPQRPIIDPRNPIRGLGGYNPVMPTRPTFDQIANDPRRSKDLTGAVVESPMFRPQVQPQPANPQRGPAPRTIQPMVTQGLAGLVNRRR